MIRGSRKCKDEADDFSLSQSTVAGKVEPSILKEKAIRLLDCYAKKYPSAHVAPITPMPTAASFSIQPSPASPKKDTAQMKSKLTPAPDHNDTFKYPLHNSSLVM